ncbi:MAG: hypothetical protein WDN45_02795 [Caulobacteraceae bacterium]
MKVAANTFAPLKPTALSEDAVGEILSDLIGAKKPLVVTSYVGRQPDAVAQLVRLCHRLGIGVYESCPAAMNFPQDDDLYQGVQWNEPFQHPALAEADAILVLDSDVPWIACHNKPSARP